MEQAEKLKIEKLEEKIRSMGEELGILKTLLNSPRVQIRNLEGALKTIDTAPTGVDYMDGTVLLYDDGADRKIYVKINDTFYSVAVT